MIPCVYCLHTGELSDEQILLRGDDFYLCAPRGQLVEGYLVIAPYRCVGCLALLPRERFIEVQRMKNIVSAFYADTYHVTEAVFYEQGRGGGGSEAKTFPLHAHLCSLPLIPDVDSLLTESYAGRSLDDIRELSEGVEGPYVYVETRTTSRLYFASDEQTRVALERMRLKPIIAALIGMPERGHWRDYPGDEELARLIERFRAFKARR